MNQNSNKRLVINLCANIVSYSSNILIAFVLTPFLINTIGKEAYSFYPIANSFVAYMGIITAALNSMASRFVTYAIANNKNEEAQIYISSILFSDILMSILLLIPMSLIIIFLDKIINIPINLVAAIKTLFCFIFASMLVNVISSVFGIATFVKNRMDIRSIMQLISGVLRIFLFYLFYRIFTPTIVYVGIVILIIALFEFLFQYISFSKLLSSIRLSITYFSFKHVRTIITSGYWNSLSSIGNLLLVSSTLILINVLYGASLGGLYSIANTVPVFINGVISMLVGVFAPSIIWCYARENLSETINTIKKAQTIVGIFTSTVLVVFISLSEHFFSLWTPNENSHILFIISTISIAPHFLIGCMWPLTNLNIAANKVKTPALIQLLLGAINIIVSVFLYKFCNTSAITVCIVSSILNLVYISIFLPLYSSYYLKTSFLTFYKIAFKMILSVSILFFAFYRIIEKVNINNWMNLFVIGLILGLIAIAINTITMLDNKMKLYLLNKLTGKWGKKFI